VEEAVLRRAAGSIVFRTDAGNRVERVAVETGAHNAGYVEVVKGLSPGDRVVARGGDRLSEGQLVVPRNPDGTLLAPRTPDVAGSPGSGGTWASGPRPAPASAPSSSSSARC